ncbi:glycerol-3-phosphate acyltransferase 2 [Bryobacterales bacterium F-183]|nr:glycerol-3-phosphate acyltransferase 2 [Bryobacterales bacterium F-183]
MITPLLLLVFAYLLGGVPFGYLLVKWRTGFDVRSGGSGNIGATNVLRTSGRALGVATLLLDIAKGYVAVWLMGRYTTESPLWMSLAALTVMAGHAFPIFLKFQGGKAVASFIGAFLRLAPWPLLAVLIVFVAVVYVTRYISLGSIVACGLFPFGIWLIEHPEWPVVVSSAIAGAFVIYRHKSNIQRLRAGTESIFRFGGKKPA